AASRPPDADRYCPECGRPWTIQVREIPRPTRRLPWRAAFLVAVGLCLAIAFGPRAVSAYETEAAAQRDPGRLRTCADHRWAGASCPLTERWLGVLHADRDDTARHQLHGALVATALGLIALVAGLGSVARRGRGRTSRSASPLSAAVWRAGEPLVVLFCFLVL